MSEINVAENLDRIEADIMSGLKDFQKVTVERIDELYREGKMRVLVSDEVGLGKTLIARGTIAKLAKLRKEQGDKLVKVVYVCSNAAIAEQNLNKLRISSQLKAEGISSSRLSMQHLNIFRQENDPDLLRRYIQLIPLTPDTSFRLTAGTRKGTVDERALMFAVLKRVPSLAGYEKSLEKIMVGDAEKAWKNWAKAWYEKQVADLDAHCGGAYLSYMIQKVEEELNDFLLEKVKAMCEDGKEINSVIGKLRVMFAKISLDKLDPDLVIMDEFQRFKYLLKADAETDTGMLANKFFYSEKVRMLLLSATPYKMYSTLEEIDEARMDEHYSEFLTLMDFLNVTKKEKDDFKEVWSNYSVKLKEFSSGDTAIIEAKNAAEDAMYQHICRTERISATESADIVDDSDISLTLRVTEQDIRSYLQAQKLLDDIGASFRVPMDYVKSSPYLMSFMRDYEYKKKIEGYFSDHPDEVGKMNKDTFWLKKKSILNYEKIPNGNARLDRVMEHVLEENAELLLWVPPSKPYYPPQGVYKNTEAFSKTLIFSSWEMVPRMLAGMISYEVERRTLPKVGKLKGKTVKYFNGKNATRYPVGRLSFDSDKGDAGTMSLFCLLYPSKFLAECYRPIDCLNRGMDLSEIEEEIQEKIAEKLEKYHAPITGNVDYRWYYMAPLFFDGAGYVTSWINKIESDLKEEKDKTFRVHLQKLRELYQEMKYGQDCHLGKQPEDLPEVLTDMAMASPAIVMRRTYQGYCKKLESFDSVWPTQIARRFISRMNTTESTVVLELACRKYPQWRKLLTYGKNGNIQAMFDEYAHLIANGLDADENLIENMHKTIKESLDIRTTIYKADSYEAFCERVKGEKKKEGEEEKKALPLRSHFAVAFTKGDGKEKDVDRKSTVRNAFNSPLRPFVLASTSIGQEGLDFHNYCRRIVHWNLPANPIDLEQREGRINRFECLAIRQNIAKRYGGISFEKDIWKEMFEEALRVENDGNGSDLIPFWGLTEQEDMIKIERIVPMYPFSRDGFSYERLIKILSLYRLTLGQARQEELLEYLFKNCKDTEDMKGLFINLSPYYKEKR